MHIHQWIDTPEEDLVIPDREWEKLNAKNVMSKHYGTSISNVSVEFIDLDLECGLDIQCNTGIRINSVDAFDTKNKNAKIWNGLQSEFFGSDFGDESAFQERYSCKCGKYTGKAWEGRLCEVCNSVVGYHDIDLTKTGWIIIDNFTIMHPVFAAKLSNALGKYEGEDVFDKIIRMKYYEEGDEPELSEKEIQMQKKHPYIMKGMLWLKENILEVLDHYERKKPGKSSIFQEIRKAHASGILWAHAIPVYSALLRTELPSEKGHTSYKLKTNTYYKTIIRLSNAINKVRTDEFDFRHLNAIDIKLGAIQRKLQQLFDCAIEDLTGKQGIIVSKVLGGRYNFSARNIIIPSSGRLRSDQIEMGYLPFLELFRYEIINFYQKLTGCTIKEASHVRDKATNHFNPVIYSIMEHMVTDPECRKYCTVLVGRNPYINYGSVIFMHVVKVKKDFSDKSLTIPTHIIRPMNADFDGDVNGVFRIIGEDLAKRFAKNLNPRYNLFISRMDMKVNRDMLPVKDENIVFWAFNVL